MAALEYRSIAAFFDEFAAVDQRWRARNRTYHELIERAVAFQVPPGSTVLEIGAGAGDLLAALQPEVGVGVDVSPRMVELARARHPNLEFVCAPGESFDGGRTFDYIVLSDVVPFVHDLIALFETVARHAHPRTRVIVHSYNAAWRPILALAERLHLRPRKPVRNWIAPEDVLNLLQLTGLQPIATAQRILMPKQVPLLTRFLNGVVANVWPLSHVGLTWWVVARPRPEEPWDAAVSIVCPCRNEQGHIAEIVARVPKIGRATELIFVEGNSTDETRAEIEQHLDTRDDVEMRLLVQTGKGKGDAVRTGFEAARNDVLMILDGDLTVAPEDLPKFHRALVEGHGELINGSRLVYDMEAGAMRLLNMLGNKLFSRLLTAITGQRMKDTLCGTKVLRREDYALIARERSYFGAFDPFGDFDLLFGAARLNLAIIDLPVRYHPRTYGETNISRFRHGWLLLRMTAFAFRKFKIAIYDRP